MSKRIEMKGLLVMDDIKNINKKKSTLNFKRRIGKE